MKLGMVFEGGANRTVFSCGVMDAFLEEELMPDYFVGVSAGIAYGVSYLSGQKGRNIEVIEKYMPDKRYMGLRHLFNRDERAFYNTKFVFEQVPNELVPFDYEAFQRYPGEAEAVVTNIHSGKAEYLTVPRDKDMSKTLVASCSLPILFQPVKIGKHYYLDGGIADSIPYERAFEMGCDKVVVVLTRERGYVKTTDKAVKLSDRLYKKYPKIVEDLDLRAERYNACMEKLMELEKEGRVFVIAPETTYGVSRTDSDIAKLRRLYEEGVSLGKAKLPALRSYLAGGGCAEAAVPEKRETEQRNRKGEGAGQMKIVFLDAKTIGDDMDLSGFDKLGEVVKYGFSTPEEAAERSRDADVLVLNKVPVNEETIDGAAHLKLVCVTATGTNNLDKEYLEKRGIAWRNVAGYSTETVAQHTFALLFYLFEKLHYYDDYVKTEKYIADTSFTHFSNTFHELNGKTWGIIGLGAIGRRVAELAKLFGCHVIYYSTSGKNNQPGYERVDFDTLLSESDIVSIHAPLDENTKGLMNAEAFAKMKRTAILLNLGRGPIVDEKDLALALKNNLIAAAGLDVLTEEPMRQDNPLRGIKDSERLIITPHIAWASVEARTRLMATIEGQIRDFFMK